MELAIRTRSGAFKRIFDSLAMARSMQRNGHARPEAESPDWEEGDGKRMGRDDYGINRQISSLEARRLGCMWTGGPRATAMSSTPAPASFSIHPLTTLSHVRWQRASSAVGMAPEFATQRACRGMIRGRKGEASISTDKHCHIIACNYTPCLDTLLFVLEREKTESLEMSGEY